jgi:uncharacterized protein
MLIVDTGPLVATVDESDPDHRICRALLEADPGPLITTAIVVTEAGWLIRRQLDANAESALYAAIAGGELTVETLTERDWARVAELVVTYVDLGLDAADASIIAVAERLDLTTIPTLDHRDFRVVRPSHCDAFDLVPHSLA